MKTPLDELEALLRKGPLTAVEIAKAQKCCKPTAYERVRALIARGVAVYEIVERRKRPGPPARAFGIRA